VSFELYESNNETALDTEQILWGIIVAYSDGSFQRYNGFQGYPDDWGTLVEKTNALIGFDFLK